MSIQDQKLRQEIIDKTQWPYGAREVQYQTVYPSLPGIRDMEHRYEIMDFPKSFKGETVIDIGCNIGMICFDAKRRGAKRVVGVDYRPETIEVAKKLSLELEFDVEFYVFDVNEGLETLKSLIGEDQFDHTFALSIWGHVDKPKLADIINFYSNKICWFEGHAQGWTGDSQEKIERDLSSLLNFKYYEYLGETTDRNPRQNYKLSHSLRVVLNDRGKLIYFDGEVYDVIRSAYELSSPGDLSFSEASNNYSFKGKFCNYVAKKDSNFGFKVFIGDDTKYSNQDLSEKKEVVERVFKIQNLLHEHNYAPKAYEIIPCHDDQTFVYAIKMDNIKGKFIDPPKEWKEKLINFCKENGLTRNGVEVEKELITSNCIESNGNIYLVDIDQKWELI